MREKTMNTRRLALISLLLSLVLTACAGQAHTLESAPTGGDGSSGVTTVDNFAALPPADQSGVPVSDVAVKGGAPNAPAALDRIVIKTATLSMVVGDPSDTAQRITALA